MESTIVSQEMILSAHHLRETLGLTFQEISDEAEKLGMHTPVSTVRRFFADDAPKHRFSAATVQGILAVLGQTKERATSVTIPEQVDFLKDIILIKDQIIEHMKSERDELKNGYEQKILEKVTENQIQIEYIKEASSAYQEQMRVKDRRMDERDRFFMSQIELKDRRYDALLEKYDALLEKYTALQSGGTL